MTVSHRSERFASSPWGLDGGAPGARAPTRYIVRADGTPRGAAVEEDDRAASRRSALGVHRRAAPATAIRWSAIPAAVLADVLDGKITANAARAEYGVVLTPDGTAVDEVKTKESRAALRRSREEPR